MPVVDPLKYARERYAAHAAAGKCTRCDEPATCGTLCPRHAELNRRNVAASKRRKREKRKDKLSHAAQKGRAGSGGPPPLQPGTPQDVQGGGPLQVRERPVRDAGRPQDGQVRRVRDAGTEASGTQAT